MVIEPIVFYGRDHAGKLECDHALMDTRHPFHCETPPTPRLDDVQAWLRRERNRRPASPRVRRREP